ncbi:AMP-binding protein [Salinimonas marina]|uniref:AMP-binding protein n=1 Tax=Salinimonas marina TaxID=2785918 RepID=A0A7S9HEB5_9ALTE|nr:AMP-binding protein [Salinimonas marina]QPG07161.1 AMP-binding protein [Salinimonas marina]
MSAYSGATDRPVSESTITQHLAQVVDSHPDQEAIVVRHQNIRWSYREYLQEIERVAAGFVALGVQPGDRVGIWSPNNIEWALVQMATAKIGAIMVCINPAYRPEELAFALNNVEVKYLVMAQEFRGSDYVEMIYSLMPSLKDPNSTETNRLPTVSQVISIGEEPLTGMLPFAELQTMAGDEHYATMRAREASLSPDQPINIQFTSGTTGNPKGATLSHRNILNNALFVAQAMHMSHEDRLCIPVPLYHCFGMVLGNLVCMVSGACAVFPAAAFDPLTTLQTVEQEKCTGLHGVPTMFIAELEHPDFEQFDLSSLRTGVMAGSTCPEELMRKVHELFHMREVVIGYGQTECSPINHITETDSPIEKQVKTVGRAMDHTEVRIIDEQGHIAPIGQAGEICARGYCVMQGYWGDEEKTNATIDEHGWLHSGDLGVMDEEGYVTIVGRIKDMIIRGGENIYPREIEEVLYLHEEISDAAVFGIPDDRYGEQVCLWLKVREGSKIHEEEIRAYLKEHLAYFKIPKYISVVTDYPMTVTGKLQKFKMREQMIKQLEAEALNA